MNDLYVVSPIKRESQKKYYDGIALKAYKYKMKSYNKGSSYDYGTINEFLQVNNVNSNGVNLINLKLSKVNKERAKNIIEIVKGIDRRMVPFNSLPSLPYNSKKIYKGITHISTRTLDSNTPIIYKSYNSTTTDYKTALNFTNPEYDEYRVILILTIDPTIKVHDYNDKDDESEILIERNTILSNFHNKTYNEKHKVFFYNALVSKYNPEPLFIPPKTYPDVIGVKIKKNKSLTLKDKSIFDKKINIKTYKTI
jgi:hypothetical protein